MKRIAVMGTGTIGHIAGAYLSRGGHDVTLVSQFRRSAAETFSAKGITVKSGDESFNVPVKARFWEDLDADELFDIIMICGSADFSADAVTKIMPHAADGAYWSSFQNGIPEDTLVPMVGRENIIPVVCHAGGRTPELGTVVTHDGYFIIGEMDGRTSPRLLELRDILSCAKRVELTDDIMSARWEKLTMVVSGPGRNVSGLDSYENPLLQTVVARCATEFYALARACGAAPRSAQGIAFPEWSQYVNGVPADRQEYFIRTANSVFAPSREELGDMAYAIPKMELAGSLVPEARLPMEGHQTTGYIVRRARELGIEVPTYNYLYPIMFRVAQKQCPCSTDFLAEAIHATDEYYR